MKIKTQFINSMVIFGVMLLIIATSVIFTNQQVQQLNKQEEIAKNIERAASELGLLSNDYLLYHESQQRARWESKFSELSDDLSNLSPDSLEQQALVNNIRANQKRLKAVFTDVVSSFENTPQNQALFQISWSRMAIQNQGMAFDAERLAQMSRDRAHQLEQTNITLIFVLLGIFGAYFFTNYLIVYRRALKSISDLQAGTRIIGSGNLDYSIKTNRQDEIGELSSAFNQMTASLKDVTASKAELEREITERTRAEAELRASRRFLEIANLHREITPLIQEFVKEVKNLTNCAAVGIRLLDESGNIPYTAYLGFSRDFYEKESPLSIKTDQCMCINVIKGTTNPSLSFYTEYGSFYMNGTTRFLATVSEEEKGKTRNMCNAVGYESVALIPIRSGTHISGLIHLADYRENMVPLEMVRQLEIATPALGISIQRILAEEALHESEQRYATTLASIGDAVIATDVNGRITFMNAVAEELTGWTLAEALTKPVTEVFNIINEYTRREADNPVSRVLREGIIVGLANHTILVRKDGTEVPIDDSGAPIRDLDGRIMGVVLVFRDITERKRAEEAIRSSEQRLHILSELAQEGIVIHDRGTIIEASESLAKMFGYGSASEMIGKSSVGLLTPESQKMLLEHVKAGSEEPYEVVGIKKDGTRFPVEIRPTNIVYKGRQVRTGIIHDLTERKRAEKALRESEQKFSTIYQSAPLAIALSLLPEGVLVDVNEGFLRMFGYSREEVIGKTSLEVGINPDPQVRERIVTELKQRGFVRNVELSLLTKSGSSIIVSNNIDVIELGGKKYIMSTAEDITKRKQAEEALRKAHDELEIRVQERTAELQGANKALKEARIYAESIVETLRESLVVLDADLRVKSANQTFYRTFKVTPEETEGIFIYDLGNRQWDIPDLRKLLEDIIPRNTKFLDFEVDHEFMGIGRKTMLLNARRIYHEGVGTQMILLAIEDITEKKTLESQLLRAQRMESIGTLAGGIAHDLNNVLSPIMMSVKLLKGKHKDEQSQKILDILEKSTKRGADLIKQVMSFARGIEGERTVLQVASVVAEIEKVMTETFSRNIEIKTDLPEDLFTISGDATQLHQVLMNLCVNAKDAMQEGGRLGISTENVFIDENYARMNIEAKVGPHVVITVSDTGTGIPPEIKERIFEPFFTTKEFGKGTGLGLSTALGIVKSHGGFMNVYSEPGKGTTFKVYLPAIKTIETKKVQEEQCGLPSGNGELVFVVDDEPRILEIIQTTLEACGYRVLTANDGAEAAALYAKNMKEIRVVLMDMMMPNMDGAASIEALRKINPEVRIIGTSGLIENGKTAHDNMNAFLTKPYTAEKLLKTIYEVLITGNMQ